MIIIETFERGCVADGAEPDRHLMTPVQRSRPAHAYARCSALIGDDGARRELRDPSDLLPSLRPASANLVLSRVQPPSPAAANRFACPATPHSRPSNPHSASGTAILFRPAVSSPEASRTPAARASGAIHQRQASENP